MVRAAKLIDGEEIEINDGFQSSTIALSTGGLFSVFVRRVESVLDRSSVRLPTMNPGDLFAELVA